MSFWLWFLRFWDFGKFYSFKRPCKCYFSRDWLCFIFIFTRKLKLGFWLIPLCALLFIGSLYLSIPLFGANLNLNFSLESLILLLALAFLPTIGGFYCTTRALSLAKSNSVQLIELSEPLFAMFFGSLFLA